MRKPFHWKARKGWYHKVKKPDGKYTNVRLSASTEEQAMRIWTQTQARSSDGGFYSVADLLRLYVADQRKQVEKGTLAETTLTRRLDYLTSADAQLGTLSIRELRPYHVLEWLDIEQGWNATTGHHASQAVKRAIEWARKVGRIETNPIDSVSVKKGEPRDFTIDRDLYRLLVDSVASDNRIRVRAFVPVLRALWLSGCRPGEIASVQVEHVSDDGWSWTLPHHKTRRKTGKVRVVRCGPCLRTLTLAAREDRKAGPLFRASVDEPFTYSRMRVRFERLKKRLAVTPDCVLYSFRHTKITNDMIVLGDVATVAELHGTSIQMIQRHYGHLSHHGDFLSDAAIRAAGGRAMPGDQSHHPDRGDQGGDQRQP